MMFWGNEEPPALTPYEPIRSYVKGNYLFNHKINSEIFFPRTTFIYSFCQIFLPFLQKVFLIPYVKSQVQTLTHIHINTCY